MVGGSHQHRGAPRAQGRVKHRTESALDSQRCVCLVQKTVGRWVGGIIGGNQVPRGQWDSTAKRWLFHGAGMCDGDVQH